MHKIHKIDQPSALHTFPRLLLAGTHSGCGKTTVTCALLQAFVKRGLAVAPFKCGPDYIDPLFHTRITGRPSHNLDLFLNDEPTVRYLLARHAPAADLAVIEGVMGFYDGVGGNTDTASASHLANATATPAILVVDGKGASLSLAATISGFARFRRGQLAGVILNRVSPALFPRLKAVIEEQAGLPVLGFLPPLPAAAFQSRHLGLIADETTADIMNKVALLGSAAEESIDIDALFSLAQSAPPLDAATPPLPPLAAGAPRPTIAVARDAAFSFHYEDNDHLLQLLGADIVFFSPLADAALPPGISGLVLGGGYPENHLTPLSQNTALRQSLKAAIANGLPTLAECGGFLYLHDTLCGHPMVGVLPYPARMTEKLGPFGYIRLTARRDNLLCPAGESIPAHEFHYAASADVGDTFTAEKTGGASYPCIHATSTLVAGFPHLHLWGNPVFAYRFVAACQRYERGMTP